MVAVVVVIVVVVKNVVIDIVVVIIGWVSIILAFAQTSSGAVTALRGLRALRARRGVREEQRHRDALKVVDEEERRRDERDAEREALEEAGRDAVLGGDRAARRERARVRAELGLGALDSLAPTALGDGKTVATDGAAIVGYALGTVLRTPCAGRVTGGSL